MGKKLSEKIWVTRIIRINTEKRFINNALIADWIIPYYSLNFIILSILPFTRTREYINCVSIIGSLVILIASIVISSYQFRLRAYKMKNHYIKLDELYRKANQNDLKKEEEDQIFIDYERELKTVENHNDYDFLKTANCYSIDQNSGFSQLSCSKIFYLRFLQLKRILFILFIFCFPILIDIWVSR